MKLKKLIEALDIHQSASCPEDFEVRGISCNSKQTRNDYLYVAIKGVNEDGHKFIPEAIARGARAIVIQEDRKDPARLQRLIKKAAAGVAFIAVKDTREALAGVAARFYGYPSLDMRVIGITGTNGKTTLSYLIEAIVKEAGLATAVLGTINYRFKNKIIPSRNTTPGPLELQSILSEIARRGIRYVIMEVSSHALDQNRTAGIDFYSAIFTNLTQDHLDYHKSLNNYFQAKSRLFKGLSCDALAVINNDDKYSRRLKGLTKAKTITYSMKGPAAVKAHSIRAGMDYTEFVISAGRHNINIRTRLIGAYNIYNILASVAWAINAGFEPKTIESALRRFTFVPGRLERVDGEGKFRIFIDYAHTPDALDNVIKSLKGLGKNRIIVVFGCGGERDKTKRPRMGRVATELADYAIITSDNPRSEDPGEIIRDIQKGVSKSNYCIIPDRLNAIAKSLSWAKPGDIVLIAGKGHENYQILKDKRIYFDDREAVRRCLKSMNC